MAGIYDEKYADMDDTILAITQEFRWEFHPYMELVRQESAIHQLETAVLYLPTVVESEMWLFVNAEILPIADIAERLTGGGGQVHMYPRSVQGIAELCSRGWRVTGRSLRAEGKKEG